MGNRNSTIGSGDSDGAASGDELALLSSVEVKDEEVNRTSQQHKNQDVPLEDEVDYRTSHYLNDDSDDLDNNKLLPQSVEHIVEDSDGNNSNHIVLLPPVATVLLNHYLNHISDENEKLRKDNEKIDAVRSMLSLVHVHVGDIDDEYMICEPVDLAGE